MDLLKSISEISLCMRLLREVQETGSGTAKLSNRDILLLEFLNKKGQMGLSEIRRYFGRTASTISTDFSNLWRKGYVEKTIDPNNQRARLVRLTETGREQLKTIRGNSAERLSFLLRDVSKTEEKALEGIIEKALKNLNEELKKRLVKIESHNL